MPTRLLVDSKCLLSCSVSSPTTILTGMTDKDRPMRFKLFCSLALVLMALLANAGNRCDTLTVMTFNLHAGHDASLTQIGLLIKQYQPGGILLYDTYGIHKKPTRTDITIYPIEATEATIEMNNSKTFNMIVLGALLHVRPMVTIESVLKALKKTLPERHHHLIPLNEQALNKGGSLIK
ncbi:MAG: 2-oxoacid:acceptor oxidoreductase family protein [Muribaculaceae bacterium]|nr:2-oxoacid:acceptor oxidoreductase family protein [Muribaculaceae bacterium]